MSKRVANTTDKTVRSGRIRYRETVREESKAKPLLDVKPIKRVTWWSKVKNYIRRMRGKS